MRANSIFFSPHMCTLPPKENIIVQYIDSGYFVNFRRKFRQCMIANETNPRCKTFLQSSSNIRREREKHLKYHYYMIHPFSNARTYWECFQTCVLIVGLIIIPLEMSTFDTYIFSLRLSKFLVDILFFADLVVTFFTGFYEKSTRRIVLNSKKVTWRYLQTYFLPDLLSCISVDLIFTLFFHGSRRGWGRQLELLNYLKAFRMITLSKYLDAIKEWKNFSTYKYKVFKLTLLTSIVLIWVASAYVLFMHTTHDPWLIRKTKEGTAPIIITTWKVFYMFFQFGYGSEAKGTTIFNRYIEMFIVSCGLVFHMYMLAQIMQILNKYHSSTNRYYHMTSQLNEYIRYKELPENLRQRILTYYEFRYQKEFFNEKAILATVSVRLKQAILLHTCQKLLSNSSMFRDFPYPLILECASVLRMEIYLPNDIVAQVGKSGQFIFFISTGTIAMYTKAGKEILHLADGEHFGEVAMLLPIESRSGRYTFVAVDCCECYTLSNVHFLKMLESYPELAIRVVKLAKLRLEHLEQIELGQSPPRLHNVPL